jgi:hypothetical protein
VPVPPKRVTRMKPVQMHMLKKAAIQPLLECVAGFT